MFIQFAVFQIGKPNISHLEIVEIVSKIKLPFALKFFAVERKIAFKLVVAIKWLVLHLNFNIIILVVLPFMYSLWPSRKINKKTT